MQEYYEEAAEEEYVEPEPVEAEVEAGDEGYWIWPELMQEPEAEINMSGDDDWLTLE